MVWAFLLLNIGVLLMSAYLRFSPRELRFASPCPWPEALWIAGIAMSTALAAILAAVNRKQLSAKPKVMALCQLLLVFPLFFAYEWLALPPLVWRPVDWAATGALVLIVAILLFLGRRDWRTWGLTADKFIPAGRILAIPTAILVAVPVVAGLAIGRLDAGFQLEGDRLIVSLLSYPLYALAQLLIFQVFLVQRLKQLTPSRASVVLVAAGLFALAHWPNGLLMAATGAAAAVWTWVYLARPNVYALALSMGLAATAFSNFLPRTITHNMRTGPIYVERCLENEKDAQIK